MPSLDRFRYLGRPNYLEVICKNGYKTSIDYCHIINMQLVQKEDNNIEEKLDFRPLAVV